MNRDFLLILLLILAAVLLLTRLDNSYLWQDEAHTGVLARNVLKFGTPRTFDGKNQIVLIYKDACRDKPIKYCSWLQFYITAASLWLFGQTTFAARLPFTLFGLGSVILCYLLAQRLFENRRVSRISVALMVFSAPFFLYMRQCRWYALAVFFTLWLLLSYLDLIEKRRFSTFSFIASSALLFHSNFAVFFAVFIGLGLHFMVFYRKKMERQDINRIIRCLMVIVVLILPFLLYISIEHGGRMSLRRTKGHLEFYFRVLNKYIFPYGFMFLSLVLFGAFIDKVFPILEKPLKKAHLWLPVFVMLSSIVLLLFADERQLRYIIHLLPLCCILLGLLVAGLLKIDRKLALLLFAVVCFTNILHTGSPFRKKIWIPLISIADELTHEYEGPVEGIVKFLKRQGRPDQTVKIIYGDFALIFYTDLLVDNGPFERESYPEWIIPRRDWFPLENLHERYIRQINSKYEKIILDYPDIGWENRPDPGYHKFRTVSDAPRIAIYKRKE